jgi:hypothetical protein
VLLRSALARVIGPGCRDVLFLAQVSVLFARRGRRTRRGGSTALGFFLEERLSFVLKEPKAGFRFLALNV